MSSLGINSPINQNNFTLQEEGLSDGDCNNLMAFILLLFTTKHKDPPAQLQRYVKALLPNYWMIFNNNNDRLLQ